MPPAGDHGAGRTTWKNPGMNEPPDLHENEHWRMAVWALRAGYIGLVVALTGLIAMSLGSTPWILAAGVVMWLAAATVTLTGLFWSMRFMLIHDTVHAQSPAQRY